MTDAVQKNKIMATTRILIHTMVICLLLTVGAGCVDEYEKNQSGAGFIEPSIEVNSEVVVAVDKILTTVISDVPTSADFNLKLTDLNGGLSKKWSSYDDYPMNEPLNPGEYIMEAYTGGISIEGFNKPYFYGQAKCSVNDGESTPLKVECRLANAMIEVAFTENMTSYFKKCALRFHSAGGSYITYTSYEKRPAFLLPGDTDLSLLLTFPDGESIETFVVTIPDTQARYYYLATVDMTLINNIPEVSVSFDEKMHTDDLIVKLTPEFVRSNSPELSTCGFESGDVYQIAEGVMPSGPLCFKAKSPTLKSLLLTINSQELMSKGWPAEIDVLRMSDSEASKMTDLGLKVSTAGNETTVDFTEAIATLHSPADNEKPVFAAIARNENGKESEVAYIEIDIMPVDIKVLNISPATIGVNETEITVLCPVEEPEKLGVDLFDKKGSWTPGTIKNIEPIGNHTYKLTVGINDGIDDQIARLTYCGLVKSELTIPRISPKFSIDVDAYALKAVIRIVPENTELTEIITSMAHIYAGDEKMVSIVRDEEKGEITVSGLQPAKKYNFAVTVLNDLKTGFHANAISVTESTSSIPNYDFEDQRLTIEYANMPSGGIYSQSIVSIFNQLNRTSFKLSTPKEWANTNSKTFNRAAKRHNTWYMQPSVYTVYDAYSGGFAVKLQSVGWDLNGEDIAPYLQTSTPYVEYSRNIPHISHRAAGKIFLGSYRFDALTMTETYNEGMPISSRPMALNGFYKYLSDPHDPNDLGLAKITVLGIVDGEETVIAEAEGHLSPVSGYKAFSIPLTYNHFGVKASKVKIMLSSTIKIGDIDEESQNVVTTDNPETSSSIGSSLWIDQLTFSY